MTRIITSWIASSTVLAAAMLSAASFAAAADPVDGPTAAARCTTDYPGVTGPDELSPCQWDMKVINALAAHGKSTGLGVKSA